MTNKPQPLSFKDIEDAVAKSIANFGVPNVMFWDPGLARQFSIGFTAGTSETHAKIRKHFTGVGLHPDGLEMRDFDIMSKAATAFDNIGLNKNQWDRGYTITKK